MIKLVKGGPPVAARIAFDDETGRWQVTINGEDKAPHTDPWQAEGMSRVWHYGRIIDEAEYTFMLARAAWARQHAPDDPSAKPDEPIDLTRIPSIF